MSTLEVLIDFPKEDQSAIKEILPPFPRKHLILVFVETKWNTLNEQLQDRSIRRNNFEERLRDTNDVVVLLMHDFDFLAQSLLDEGLQDLRLEMVDEYLVVDADEAEHRHLVLAY